MDIIFIQQLLIALFIGVASGSIGTFIILKRMALASDALSHIALPGIALSIAYNFDPFFGILVFLFIASFIIWKMEEKTKLPTEALIGLLFTTSLAIGILTIPDHELIESLFGKFSLFSLPFLILTLFTAIILIFLTFFLTKKFIFMTISSELANVEGIKSKYKLYLLIIFVFIIALGIKLVGTLLMGALTIIPPLIARNISHNMKSFMVISAITGGIISVTGTIITKQYNFLPGPTIILLGIFIFFISMFFIKRQVN